MVALAAFGSVAHAQSGWDRYQPGKLSTIIERHRTAMAGDSSGVPHFVISTATFPTRAELTYGGQTRAILADSRRVLQMWAQSMGMDTSRVAEYEEEWLFHEGSLALWLPVQRQTAESMRPVVKKGMRVTVWAQWFGAVRRDGRVSWVFPAMQTQTHEGDAP